MRHMSLLNNKSLRHKYSSLWNILNIMCKLHSAQGWIVTDYLVMNDNYLANWWNVRVNAKHSLVLASKIWWLAASLLYIHYYAKHWILLGSSITWNVFSCLFINRLIMSVIFQANVPNIRALCSSVVEQAPYSICRCYSPRCSDPKSGGPLLQVIPPLSASPCPVPLNCPIN